MTESHGDSVRVSRSVLNTMSRSEHMRLAKFRFPPNQKTLRKSHERKRWFPKVCVTTFPIR